MNLFDRMGTAASTSSSSASFTLESIKRLVEKYAPPHDVFGFWGTMDEFKAALRADGVDILNRSPLLNLDRSPSPPYGWTGLPPMAPLDGMIVVEGYGCIYCGFRREDIEAAKQDPARVRWIKPPPAFMMRVFSTLADLVQEGSLGPSRRPRS